MRRFPAIVAFTAAATACALLAAMPSVAAPVDPDTSKVVVAPKFSSSPVIPSANEAMLRPYSGLGTWADVYDWSRQYGGAKLGISDIDAMAKAGVQTLFIQTTKYGSTGNVLEPARLKALIRRAHNRGMSVVAWYLPSFVNEKRDFFKMNAMLTLGIDGITVDIESTANKNVPSRNAALIRLLKRLDVAIRRSGQPIAVGAATYTPHTLDHSVRMWPNFPWEQMSPYVHVWMPMSYWSQFLHGKSGMGNATTFTADTINRLRAHLGAQARIHLIGGSGMDPNQVSRMINQIRSVANPPLGGSLYDWRVTSETSRRLMRPLSQLRTTAVLLTRGVASSGNATATRTSVNSAKVTWWSPDGSTVHSLDTGGVLASDPSLALAENGTTFMVSAQVSKIPNRDDWRTQFPGYMRMSANGLTGAWREIPSASAGCVPSVARISGKRFMAVCLGANGAVTFAYLPDSSVKWSHWFTLAGVPSIPTGTVIAAAGIGSTAAISWVDGSGHVQIATWTVGQKQAAVVAVSGPRSGPMLSSTSVSRLNTVSPNAMTLTFTGPAGVYRVAISFDSGVTIGQPDAPSAPGVRTTVPAALEFNDGGWAFADVVTSRLRFIPTP